MENSDFGLDMPQRQSVKGILIMFADALQKFIRGFWPLLLLLFIKMKSHQVWIIAIGLFFVLVILAIIAYLQYYYFTFHLDTRKKEFIISKGVIQKSRITVQLHKIQQVNINQTFIQKLIDVYSLDIDTAGSSKKEVSIRAIDRDFAEYLKGQLLDQEDETVKQETGKEAEGIQEVNNEPFLKISMGTLLKVGITSNYGRSIALLIGFFAALYNGISDLVTSFDWDQNEVEGVFEQGVAFISVGIVIGILLAGIFIINLVRTFIRFFDFKVIRQRYSLLISSGLFAKKNTLLRPSKVQITSYSQNFFQKKFNIFDLWMKQASSNDEAQSGGKNSFVEIPGCNRDELNIVLKMILPALPDLDFSMSPNFRYVFRAVLIGIFIPLAAFFIASITFFDNWADYVVLIPVYVILMGIFIFFRFKNYRLFVEQGFIVLKSGAWDVSYEVIEPYKLQGVTTRQFFWHKKADVGHVVFHTAAGDLSFRFAKYSEIKTYIDYWLYCVESSDKSWM